MPDEPKKQGVRRRLIDGTKRELGVFLRTFGVAWLALAIVLLVYAIVTSPSGFKGAGDVALTLVVGLVMMLFYAFWPAVAVASIRVIYRLVGMAAFVPIPVVGLGLALSFWLFGGWLGDLLRGVFASLTNVGPCGAHAGGPVALFCLGVAVLGSPSGIWALVKLLLGLSLVVVLGALPGIVLFVILVVRAVVVRLRKAS